MLEMVVRTLEYRLSTLGPKNRMKFELLVNIGGIADVVFVSLASNISFCSHRVRFQLGKKSR